MQKSGGGLKAPKARCSAGLGPEQRGCVTTRESRSAVSFFIHRNGGETSPCSTPVETSKGSEMFPSTITELLELLSRVVARTRHARHFGG